MRIESITVSDFRCFGPNEVVVSISDDVTTNVGPNAAGTTALLQAIMLGTLSSEIGKSTSQIPMMLFRER